MSRRVAIIVLAAAVVVLALAAYIIGRMGPGGQAAAETVQAGAGQGAAAAAVRPEMLVRPHSPVIGPASAPVTIVEFFDPACEACRAFHPYVKQILATYPQQVRLVLRYVPFHGRISVEGVQILEAARRQGRFEPVLEALLQTQSAWASHSQPAPERAWEAARAAGLDESLAREYAATGATERLLEQDIADVTAIDIGGTPTFYINGRELQQSDPDSLLAMVRSELERMPLAR